MLNKYKIFDGRKFQLIDVTTNHRNAEKTRDEAKALGGSVRLTATKRNGRPSYAVYVRW